MRWYRNMKITRQLTVVVAALVVGFIAIGFAYNRVLTVENSTAVRLQGLIAFQSAVEKARSDLLTAQRFGKDFQITNRLEELEGFDTTMSRGLETMSTLADLSPTADTQAVITQATGIFSSYQTAVYEAAEYQLSIGLDANTGLLGDLADVSASLNTVMKKNANTAIEASFLRIRGHEKDYITLGQRASIEKISAEYIRFKRVVKGSSLKADAKSPLLASIADYQVTFEELVENIDLQNAARDSAQALADELGPMFDGLIDLAVEGVASSREDASSQSTQITIVFAATLFAIFAVMTGLLLMLARKLAGSLGRLQDTISQVSEGDFKARTQLDTEDELGVLGRAFDSMLDDRLTQLSRASKENDQLNDSVVSLMEAVSQLSEKDLTVTVPVSEDVTGPVADAINLMAEETARVLREINVVSRQVGKAAHAVKGQGDRVSAEAANERKVVSATMEKLNSAVKAMTGVAQLAQSCNEIAGKASESTESAVQAVASTSDGMNDIRETISETEKRIKRLGERSQEINSVVDIINNIAERTHVLALNASMQAAAAGEAGRGFGVVADEVQRLAESSRESTSQIGALVSNIQAETAETMATMNKTISQVVEGTTVAERAGQQMKETQSRTLELAKSVQQIAQSSTEQAKVSTELHTQAAQIQASTEKTRSALAAQSSYTEKLVEFARTLLNTVRVFKVDASEVDGSELPVLTETRVLQELEGDSRVAGIK